MFDSSTAIHYPHDMDISYEPSNNYTVRARDPRESRSAEGKRQFYAAGHHRVPGDPVAASFSDNYLPHEIDSCGPDWSPWTAGRYPSKVKLSIH